MLLLTSLLLSLSISAADDFFSLTWDNDLFVGNDSGYTNGLYLSWITAAEGEEQEAPQLLIKPLLWSLDDQPAKATLTATAVGQSMITPEDITIEVPDENELPYSGLLYYKNTYLSIHDKYADSLETTIGVVGPASGAEATQKFIHEITGSDEPEGWDSQLDNEVVFQFARGRSWRYLVSENGHFDLLFGAQAAIGTISSYVGGAMTLRYGRNLSASYPTHLFNTSRISNPISVSNGWEIYARLNASYLFNQIFTDGNTFEDSPSIDYDPERVGLGIGFSYSWRDISIAVTINDSNLIAETSEEELEEFTKYGSVTVSWRY